MAARTLSGLLGCQWTLSDVKDLSNRFTEGKEKIKRCQSLRENQIGTEQVPCKGFSFQYSASRFPWICQVINMDEFLSDSKILYDMIVELNRWVGDKSKRIIAYLYYKTKYIAMKSKSVYLNTYDTKDYVCAWVDGIKSEGNRKLQTNLFAHAILSHCERKLSLSFVMEREIRRNWQHSEKNRLIATIISFSSLSFLKKGVKVDDALDANLSLNCQCHSG